MATLCNPLAPGNTDTDGDGIADNCDEDDDNDGIIDWVECAPAFASYGSASISNPNTQNSTISGIQFGSTSTGSLSIVSTGVTNVNPHAFTTMNISNTTIYYPTTGSTSQPAIVNTLNHYNNQNIYTDYTLTLSSPVTKVLLYTNNWDFMRTRFTGNHRERLLSGGTQFTYDAATRELYDAAPGSANSLTRDGYGVIEITSTDGLPFTSVAFRKSTDPNAGPNPDGNNHDGFIYTFAVNAACDTDGDGTPNDKDLDSDGDGCYDAIEGGANFNLGNLNPNGSLSGSVSATGIPTSAGTGQSVGISQNASQVDSLCRVTITGTIFNDINGNTIIDGTEVGTSAGTNLYVYLVDSTTNLVIDSAKINPTTGLYTLDGSANTKYTLILSTNQYPIGHSNTTSPITTNNPANWINTGENGNNNTGPGDGTPDGKLKLTTGTTNVTNQNFGLRLDVICPQNLSYILIPCFSGSLNCEDSDGIITCSGQFETIENGIIPFVYGTETYPSSFSAYMNSTNQGVIADTSIFSGVFYKTSITLQTPTKTLYTRTWFLVTTDGDTITCTQEIEFNLPASLPVTYTSVSGACTGTNSIEITSPLGSQYEYSIDKGLTWQSSTIFNNVLPGRYDIILRADSVLYCGEASVVFNKYICGTVFNDVNGNTNIDGTESGFLPESTPTYIYLVDEFDIVLAVSEVASNGTYSFERSFNESGTFTLHLSTNLYVLGEETYASIIVQDLPGGWVNSGENGTNNTGAGDLSPNGILTVVIDSTNRTNQNFGLAPIPIADDKTYLGLDPQTTRFLPTNNATYPNAMPLNNVTGSAQGIVSLIDGTMPGNVTGTDYNAGYIGAAAGANNNMTFVTDGVVYDPNSPTTPLTNTVLAYNFEGQNFLLNPDPTAADPSYIFWNPTKGQYEIPQFNPNNLNVWFNVEGQTGFIFEYAWINQAGVQGENATYLVNATGPLAILPVELTSFEVEVVNSDVQLTWTTASEKNNDRFEIERSSDGINFVKVGTVKGNGTTSLPQAYNFTDINPGVGVHYYRLKQVDFDAQFEYSPIKSAEIVGTVSISFYPNPVQNLLNIEVKDTRLGEINGTIVLYNAAGAEIIRESLVGSDRRQLDVSQIPSGTYLLRYQSEEMIKTFKVVISH